MRGGEDMFDFGLVTFKVPGGLSKRRYSVGS